MEEQASSLLNIMMNKVRNSRLFILLLLSLFGCAAPPRLVTLSDVALNPGLYKNITIQLAGSVKENRYIEGDLALWELSLTDGYAELHCFKMGHNLSLLRYGAGLAENAKEEKGIVIVTGSLTSLRGIGIKTGSALEIQRLSYKDKSAYVEVADYPPSYYYDSRYPYFPSHRLRGFRH